MLLDADGRLERSGRRADSHSLCRRRPVAQTRVRPDGVLVTTPPVVRLLGNTYRLARPRDARPFR